ncbi:MAG TPA: exodeoxyribonuclease V subunit beta [Smithella sp.]|nr:exodeoxyribonuclease V subunit beta [Smithella sp.]
MLPFNLSQCPLNGVNLIEASAGTGKTHALAGLYLRLIIENKLTPQQILVITFTNAATAELKSRIRKMLNSARQAFQTGDAADELFKNLLETYSDEQQRKSILQKLSRVLADYDETAIHTIHGFCDRILKENAFESGMMFDAEIISNQQHIEEEFVADYWRNNFYENHHLIVKYALDHGFNKEKLLKVMKEAAAKPDLRIIPDLKPPNVNDLEVAYMSFLKIFNDFRKTWKNQKEEIVALLGNEALNKNSYGKQIEKIAFEADCIANLDEPSLPLPSILEKLTGEKINKDTKKGWKPPQHAVFLICDNLFRQSAAIEKTLDNHLMYLQKDFLEELKNRLPQIKREKNVLYYDDLLLQAKNALCGDAGLILAEVLRGKYKAVLVDEFQDTDPIQFAILESIFIKDKKDAGAPVFYIGDPKQAIYSFRGADVFAYLKAVKQASRKYTMMNNWRSEEGLINAVNTLFESSNNPFVYYDIEYVKVAKPPAADATELRIDDDSSASMRLLFLPADEGLKKAIPVNLSDARRKIIHAVAAEVARLLKLSREGKAFIGDEPLKESDIAILVRKNSQAADFQRILSNAGIPSTLNSNESVFKTAEAEELKRFLLGVVQHDNNGLLLGALATSLVGLDAAAINVCINDDRILEQWRSKFRTYHDYCNQRGFLTMFYLFLEHEHIRPRIMAYVDGVRKMTNYLHLAEEIHLVQVEEKLSLAEVLRWFDLMKSREGIIGEREQIRLDDDRNAVRLVTIHKSKGLEYPVVFCPFVWEGAEGSKKSELFCFHDEQNDRQLTCDLDYSENSSYLMGRQKEFLAEESRLLYVALTRAKNRCYFVWGNIKNIKNSALYYLLYSPAVNDSDDKNLTNESMLERVKCLTMLAPKDINISSIDDTAEILSFGQANAPVDLTERRFNGNIDPSWKIASFTYLTSAKKVQPEDMLPIAEEEYQGNIVNNREMNREDMFSFPRGTTAGSLLHEILEGVRFDEFDASETKSVILEKLRKYNYDEKWEPAISRMVVEIGRLNLTPGESSHASNMDNFSLARIPAEKYLKEMEFYFPLKHLSMRKITRVLKMSKVTKRGQQNRDLYGSLNFPDLRGFLKGFIDMVFEYENRFYLLDWKSNYLGAGFADYSPDLLKSYMSKSSYVLQYLIYVVALDKYLQTKIKNYSYENNFGGVYYIFLRGISSNAAENNGVYFDRPDLALFKQLKKTFQS